MKFDPEDARLTAHALGELDPADRAEVEKLLAEDPAAQAEFAEIQKMATLLQAELAGEPCPSLTNAQREELREGPVVAKTGVRRHEIFDGTPVRHEHPGDFPERDDRGDRARPILFRLSDFLVPLAACCLIGLVMLQALGTKVSQVFQTVNSKLDAAGPAYPSDSGTPQSPQPVQIARIDQVQPTPYPIAPKTRVRLATPDAQGSPNNLGDRSNTDPSRTSAKPVAVEEPTQNGQSLKSEEANRTRNSERYKAREENQFLEVRTDPLSTFSIDVDTASYANVRRYLTANQLPPADAVRLEEMVNYFPYAYPGPVGEVPFAANVEIAECPWSPQNRLVRFGLKGKFVDETERAACNLVFLIDVSGSMNVPDRLPLVQASLRLLVRQLQPRDRVAIVVYAGNSGLVLESTSCKQKETILSAIDRLSAGGSTNGGAGIQLAYSVAKENFIKGGINRVILATDGDFNVGVSSDDALVELITQKAKSGVYLSVLGFGSGNYQDAKMQQLADKGNGNHTYIDTLQEARKALVEQANGTLVTIAKDVKIQVEFNPERVAAYRLLGYEKRMLAKEDFNDDTKDAGEIGAGHSVTALYEIVPVGKTIPRLTDPLKYQNQALTTVPNDAPPAPKSATASQELLTLKLRYKKPDAEKSDKVEEIPVMDGGATMSRASTDFKFQAAVAAFSMLLTDSKYRGEDTFNLVLNLAQEGRGQDEDGYRAEFIKLVRTAQTLRDGRSEGGRE